jgi:hypothetical protein
MVVPRGLHAQRHPTQSIWITTGVTHCTLYIGHTISLIYSENHSEHQIIGRLGRPLRREPTFTVFLFHHSCANTPKRLAIPSQWVRLSWYHYLYLPFIRRPDTISAAIAQLQDHIRIERERNWRRIEAWEVRQGYKGYPKSH